MSRASLLGFQQAEDFIICPAIATRSLHLTQGVTTNDTTAQAAEDSEASVPEVDAAGNSLPSAAARSSQASQEAGRGAAAHAIPARPSLSLFVSLSLSLSMYINVYVYMSTGIYIYKDDCVFVCILCV